MLITKSYSLKSSHLEHPLGLTMKYSILSAACLVSLGECLSLPPLIPSIPGVTEPLTTNAPPLPILQVPTPPLESPPFTPSEIKPKKIGYFWTGAGDKFHKGRPALNLVLFATGSQIVPRLFGYLQPGRRMLKCLINRRVYIDLFLGHLRHFDLRDGRSQQWQRPSSSGCLSGWKDHLGWWSTIVA